MSQRKLSILLIIFKICVFKKVVAIFLFNYTSFTFFIIMFVFTFNPHMHKKGPVDASALFLVTIFTQKMPESSGSMYCHISDIFPVKLIAKDILLGSLKTQHQAVFAIWCLFLKKHKNFQNQTVTLKCFFLLSSRLVWFM